MFFLTVSIAVYSCYDWNKKLRSLLRFIQKYYFFLLFLVLQVIALSLFLNNHAYQRSKMVNSSNVVVGTVYNAFHSITQYLSLKQANDELVKENLDFHNELLYEDIFSTIDQSSTIPENKYNYQAARVIKNSVNKKNNTLTLNIGTKAGIAPEMAVVSPMGVVGITRYVSANFTTAISVLSNKYSLSAKLKRNNYFGSLVWEDDDYRVAYLNEIPGHVDLHVGDTLVTSGYSVIFPEGIMIGTINEFTIVPGDHFYDIKVDLAVDYKKLDHVYVIENIGREEQVELENKLADD